jgi:SAM-dependent methyltransferase
MDFCRRCGHIFNRAFNPGFMEYTQDYENSLHFSPRFQSYADRLARRLVEQYDLHDKDIVEIGSGQGDFLVMLCELGGNRGVGFDPTCVDEGAKNGRPVSFVRDYYSEKYAGYPADFICSRHVLEHIPQPAEFLNLVRRVVGQRQHIVLFFEVPNVLYTVRQLGIWDIIYEHCSYFSPYSLAVAFEQSGFHVMETNETFGGQFLTAEGQATGDAPIPPDAEQVEQLAKEVALFTRNYQDKVSFWQERLAQIARQGQRAVVWGAGSKGVTFMNTLKSQDVIEYAVDINPRKKGMFISGSGQEIVPPEFLQTYRPDFVILMNTNYEKEIGGQLEALGLATEILKA